jgi:nucleotide-binding universal stress UspA family protein
MKILVCTDGSEYAEKALAFAAELAKNYKAELGLLYVVKHDVSMVKVPDDEYGNVSHKAKEIIKKAKKTISQTAAGVNVQDRIAVGPVSSEIVRIAEEEKYDTIVIGTRGLTGLRRVLLGSVAEDVIHHAHCPVTVVR